MARSRKTLEAIIADVRSCTGRSRDRNFGIDEYENIKAIVQQEQRRLWWDHDWQFLKSRWDLSVVAGSRYYSVPAMLCFERISSVCVKFGSEWIPLERGISMSDYSLYDSDDDERSSPAMKWDVIDVAPNDDAATREQIEIWPLSSNAQTVRFEGIRNLDAFVSDDHYCTVDADILTMFSAARIKPEDEKILAAANRLLAKARSKEGGRQTFSMAGDSQGAYKAPFVRKIFVSPD